MVRLLSSSFAHVRSTCWVSRESGEAMESPAPTGARSREGIEDLVTHLIPTKPYDRYIDDTVFLDVKEHLNQHPDKLVQRWNEHPRLYTLLRMLGYEDDGQVFKAFDREQIGDVWLPLSDQTLNYFSSIGLSASEFYRTQLHILSKSERMSEQQLLSEVHAHRYILSGRSHFDDIEILGTGGSAEVARVRHKLSGKQFACKRIWRGKSIKEQRDQLVEFEQEVGVLQRISHKHLVSFVASYTDFETFSLILNPVAKDVLKSVIMRQSRERPLPAEDVWTLRRAFGCLATALAYLHEQRVRHKDIKPGNILLTDGRVYLCDFGISRDWSKSEHSTTEGDVLKFTRRYCAPEVFGRDPRNSASDIWSLGCVFLELITVIKGYPIDEMNQFMLRHSADASAQGLWCAQEAMNAWLVKIRSENNNSADDVPLDWITPMIRTDPEDRPKASDVVDMIHKQSAEMPHPDLYIAPCCHRSDSITPIEGVESPTLHEPTFSNVLGIRNVPSSPPRPYLDVVPNRNQSPVIAGRRSPRVADRRRGSRDRSISPTTQSYPKQLDSTDTIPFPMDPIQSPNIAKSTSITSQTIVRFVWIPEISRPSSRKL
ncbi:kinase-like protein [Zopfia rhizophila CBS 207.26]|uniref:Kinase-like protein n=1 Tax=Zopfia rhizophila CBS 207.26 TaxID=1314779 RepID=A0A6A6D9R9_9PEZI|nr:kinase-like protein [Zopfia rhizophila CBS 207.26]